MTDLLRMRWLVGVLWLACMSGCAKQEAAPPTKGPPPTVAEAPPPEVVRSAPVEREYPHPHPVSSSGPSRPEAQPNYAWLPPKEPMIEGSSGVFSIAVSFGSTTAQLQDFLLQHRINSLRPAKNPTGNQGKLQSQDGGAVVYIRAKLSCMGLTCPPDSGSIQTLAAGHTAYWEWPVEPPADESGAAVISVQFEGGSSADGADFKPIEGIPAIQVPITIHWVDWIKTVRETLEALAAIAGVILSFWHWLLPLLRGKKSSAA